jgi:hypothetical protein
VKTKRIRQTRIFIVIFWFLAIGVLAATLEVFYFTWVYETLSSKPPEAQLMAVYSGTENREGWTKEWGQSRPSVLFLFSGYDYTENRLESLTGLPISRIILENRARTTDQNACYSAPLIKKTGVKEMVLALPWYHLPRALFLTRYYLLGSGITLKPFATVPLSPDWFFNRWFWEELFKFWGSLGRIGLSWFGIENWPPHMEIYPR